MRVFVSGSGGYIGSVLVPHLREHGHEVTGYDILEQRDVRNTGLLEYFMQKQEAVIWLAAMSNNDWCVKNPQLHKSINVDALECGITIAEHFKIPRFIYASSVAAYGSVEDATEDRALDPTTPYGEAKARCERALAISKLAWTVTRSASVCGPSPRLRIDITVNKMWSDAKQKGFITVNGGEQKRCHIHIDDLCEFYAMLLEKEVPLQTFNVVAENEKIVKTAVQVCKSMANGHRRGIDMPYIMMKEPTDDRSYTVSGEKMRAFGFEPQFTVADAVRALNA